MKLKPGCVGVVVPARRVPVALREKVKKELQCMEEQGVIPKTELHYLGHVLTAGGLQVDPQCVQNNLEMPTPKIIRNSSEHCLKDLLAATGDDSNLTKLREYAETAWLLHKLEFPAQRWTYWGYRD
ncbi:uncharacterized protein LOC144134710 [Amblyomma americanum]